MVRQFSSEPTWGRSFSKAWLEDKSVWPIIAIIGIATVLCGGFSAYTFIYNEDVRF